ncbi:SDR family oxidoreductase [Myxococcota bacterium]|nr:SDR family oxidoreductase [Myxococcota bacterium]
MGEAAARVVQSLGGEIVAADIKKPSSFEYERYLEVDLSDPAAIEQMVAETAGAGPIDRLFYCAGLPGGRFTNVEVMMVNFVGLRHTIETAIPHMPGNGAVVSISSSAGMAYMMNLDKITPLLETVGFDQARAWVEDNAKHDWMDGYAFSKMCVIAYTMRRAPGLTTDTGIRLNCTSPGPTDTPMMPAFVEQAGAAFMDAYPKPVGRNSTSEEQGWPLAFLNSDAASYVSGENLYTDGAGAAGLSTGTLKVELPVGD